MIEALLVFEWAVFAYFLLVNTCYGVLLLSAAHQMGRHLRQTAGELRGWLSGSAATPRVSMLAPAYGEEATIAESVRALLNHHYPNLELVVVNDGSKDRTLDVLRQTFELEPVRPIYQRVLETREVRGIYRSSRHPGLVVVDKANGGKADALNVGVQVASGDLVCAMDADTLLEPDALLRMIRPFLLEPEVDAVGGTIRVANESRVEAGRVVEVRAPRTALAGMQTMERKGFGAPKR